MQNIGGALLGAGLGLKNPGLIADGVVLIGLWGSKTRHRRLDCGFA